MIHLIYCYYIIAALILGYWSGDPFDKDGFGKRLLGSMLWLPALIGGLLKELFKKIMKQDIVCLTLTHLFNYDPFKDNEKRDEIMEHLDKKLPLIWEKTRIGRYKLRAFRKLQQLTKSNPK